MLTLRIHSSKFNMNDTCELVHLLKIRKMYLTQTSYHCVPFPSMALNECHPVHSRNHSFNLLFSLFPFSFFPANAYVYFSMNVSLQLFCYSISIFSSFSSGEGFPELYVYIFAMHPNIRTPAIHIFNAYDIHMNFHYSMCEYSSDRMPFILNASWCILHVTLNTADCLDFKEPFCTMFRCIHSFIWFNFV